MLSLLQQRFPGGSVFFGTGAPTGNRRCRSPSAAKRDRASERTAGYALTDALVALLVLAMALIFSINAFRVSRAMADQATELRQAQVLITEILEAGPRTLQDTNGVAAGFAWQLQMRPTGSEAAIPTCHRQVTLSGLHTHHAFLGATLETCPPGAG